MHTCCTCLLLNATSTHSPSICSSIRRHLLISALFMHLPTVLCMGLDTCARHSLFRRTDPNYTVILYSSCGLNKRPAATLAFLLSVSVLSSQYLFQRGPIWMCSDVVGERLPLRAFITTKFISYLVSGNT